MCWKSSKGSITVFYSIVLTALVIGIMLVVVQYTKEQKRIERMRMTQMASERILANYSTHLFEAHGLLGYHEEVYLPESYLQHVPLKSLYDDLYQQGYQIARNHVPLEITKKVLFQLEKVKDSIAFLNKSVSKVDEATEDSKVRKMLELEDVDGSEYIQKGMAFIQSLAPPVSDEELPAWEPDFNTIELSDDLSRAISCIDDEKDQNLVEHIFSNIRTINWVGHKNRINEGLKAVNEMKKQQLNTLEFVSETVGINRLLFHEFLLGTFELEVDDEHSLRFFQHDLIIPHIGGVFSRFGNEDHGRANICASILAIRTAIHGVAILKDPKEMAIYESLAVSVSALTLIPPTVIKVCTVITAAVAKGALDVNKLYKGKGVDLFEVSELETLSGVIELAEDIDQPPKEKGSNATRDSFKTPSGDKNGLSKSKGSKAKKKLRIETFYSDYVRLLLWTMPKDELIRRTNLSLAKSLGDLYGEGISLKSFFTSHKIINTKDLYEYVNNY